MRTAFTLIQKEKSLSLRLPIACKAEIIAAAVIVVINRASFITEKRQELFFISATSQYLLRRDRARKK